MRTTRGRATPFVALFAGRRACGAQIESVQAAEVGELLADRHPRVEATLLRHVAETQPLGEPDQASRSRAPRRRRVGRARRRSASPLSSPRRSARRSRASGRARPRTSSQRAPALPRTGCRHARSTACTAPCQDAHRIPRRIGFCVGTSPEPSVGKPHLPRGGGSPLEGSVTLTDAERGGPRDGLGVDHRSSGHGCGAWSAMTARGRDRPRC